MVPGTVKVHEGTRRPGDVLIEYGLKPRRTAVVVETVRTKSAYGKDFIIPEGTRLFAENFTLVTREGWAGQKQNKQAIDPIEWCAVLPHGVNGKQAGSDTACVFWEGPTQARYMQEFGNGGFGFRPRMFGTSGMPGPVPKIKVQPVDFGVEIVSQLRVAKVSSKRVELEVVLTDGTSEQRVDQATLAWKDGQKVSYQDAIGQFEVAASEGYTSVEFRETASSAATRGQPVLRVCVDSSGALNGEPQIATSSGNAQLDEAALQVAKKGHYTADKGQTGSHCFKFRVEIRTQGS
jgi:TonB family protein